MPRLRIHLAPRLAILALACALTGTAQAGRVTLFSYNGGGNLADQSAEDTISVSRAGGYAAAHQYGGGVGVFASAISRGINMQAQASARSITSFVVSCPLDDLDGLVCGLDFTLLVSGSTTVSHQRNSLNPNVFGTAEAGYLMAWSVTAPGFGASGGGEVHQYARDNGSFAETSAGDPFTSHHQFFVDNGARVTVVLQASAGAFTDNNGDGGASAAADFEHTLRWGGVQAAYSASGRVLDLSRVKLIGEDGYDYAQAAPPNPFVTSVPEPASWALMLAGAGLLAWRRRAQAL